MKTHFCTYQGSLIRTSLGFKLPALLSFFVACASALAQWNVYFPVPIVSFSPTQVVLQVNVPGGGEGNVEFSTDSQPTFWLSAGRVDGSGIVTLAIRTNVTSMLFRGVTVSPPAPLDTEPHVYGFIHTVVKPGLSVFMNKLVGPTGVTPLIYPAAPRGLCVTKIAPSGLYDTHYCTNGDSDLGMSLGPSEAFLVNNPSSNPFDLYFLGEAPSVVTNILPAGWSLCGAQWPPYNAPGFAAQDGDLIHHLCSTNGQIAPYAIFASFDSVWHSPSSGLPLSDMNDLGEVFWAKRTAGTTWNAAGSVDGFGNFTWSPPRLASSPGQASVFTWNTNSQLGLVRNPDGVTPASGTLVAELLGGATPGQMVSLLSGCSFGTGADAGYLNCGAVAIPGSAGGQPGFFKVRVWDGAAAGSYADAQAKGCLLGESEVFSVALSSPLISGEPGGLPPALNAFHSFNLSSSAPCILVQPTNQCAVKGAAAAFQVTAIGEAPLRYQWLFNGAVRPGATNAGLTLPNVQPADAGLYRLVVSNRYHSVTSSVASLSVLGVPVSLDTTPGTMGLDEGGLRLRVTNLTGQGRLVIEASSDLKQWLPIFTNPPTFGELDFRDPTATNSLSRYYRVVIPGL